MAKILKGDFSKAKSLEKVEKKQDKAIPGYQLMLSVAFSDPLIWRRIQIPGQITLADLHRVIQVCMDWKDLDTHQFLVGKIFYSPGFGIEDFKKKPEYDEAAFKLHQLEEGMQFLFTYLYDGGEGWELQIALEEIIDSNKVKPFPMMLDGQNGCPPEAVGDIHQYQAMLGALERSGAEMESISLDIDDEQFDPGDCDHQKINQLLKELK